jgi:hypothetical protein
MFRRQRAFVKFSFSIRVRAVPRYCAAQNKQQLVQPDFDARFSMTFFALVAVEQSDFS